MSPNLVSTTSSSPHPNLHPRTLRSQFRTFYKPFILHALSCSRSSLPRSSRSGAIESLTVFLLRKRLLQRKEALKLASIYGCDADREAIRILRKETEAAKRALRFARQKTEKRKVAEWMSYEVREREGAEDMEKEEDDGEESEEKWDDGEIPDAQHRGWNDWIGMWDGREGSESGSERSDCSDGGGRGGGHRSNGGGGEGESDDERKESDDDTDSKTSEEEKNNVEEEELQNGYNGEEKGGKQVPNNENTETDPISKPQTLASTNVNANLTLSKNISPQSSPLTHHDSPTTSASNTKATNSSHVSPSNSLRIPDAQQPIVTVDDLLAAMNSQSSEASKTNTSSQSSIPTSASVMQEGTIQRRSATSTSTLNEVSTKTNPSSSEPTVSPQLWAPETAASPPGSRGSRESSALIPPGHDIIRISPSDSSSMTSGKGSRASSKRPSPPRGEPRKSPRSNRASSPGSSDNREEERSGNGKAIEHDEENEEPQRGQNSAERGVCTKAIGSVSSRRSVTPEKSAPPSRAGSIATDVADFSDILVPVTDAEHDDEEDEEEEEEDGGLRPTVFHRSSQSDRYQRELRARPTDGNSEADIIFKRRSRQYKPFGSETASSETSLRDEHEHGL